MNDTQIESTPTFYVKRNLAPFAAMMGSMCAIIPSSNLGALHSGPVGKFVFICLCVLLVLAEITALILIMKHRNDRFQAFLKPAGIQIAEQYFPQERIQEVKIIQSILQIRLCNPKKYVTYAIETKQKQEILALLRSYTSTHEMKFVEK